ncbi:MAG: hypothetical protein M1814_004912 [Vezdaea aestivalis]|nr:MAG: hypothetical protein M1814_004912 [Vezdaea aestivalis]
MKILDPKFEAGIAIVALNALTLRGSKTGIPQTLAEYDVVQDTKINKRGSLTSKCFVPVVKSDYNLQIQVEVKLQENFHVEIWVDGFLRVTKICKFMGQNKPFTFNAFWAPVGVHGGLKLCTMNLIPVSDTESVSRSKSVGRVDSPDIGSIEVRIYRQDPIRIPATTISSVNLIPLPSEKTVLPSPKSDRPIEATHYASYTDNGTACDTFWREFKQVRRQYHPDTPDPSQNRARSIGNIPAQTYNISMDKRNADEQIFLDPKKTVDKDLATVAKREVVLIPLPWTVFTFNYRSKSVMSSLSEGRREPPFKSLWPTTVPPHLKFAAAGEKVMMKTQFNANLKKKDANIWDKTEATLGLEFGLLDLNEKSRKDERYPVGRRKTTPVWGWWTVEGEASEPEEEDPTPKGRKRSGRGGHGGRGGRGGRGSRGRKRKASGPARIEL